MVGCFLDFQEIKESPRKIQKPLTERQVSRKAPQSKFRIPLSLRQPVNEKNNHCPGVAFMYRNTLIAASM